MRISKRYLDLARIYLHLAYQMDATLDYSGAALLSMYHAESFGDDTINNLKMKRNGYAYGKTWFDWQISNWLDGLREGTLSPRELLEDRTLLPGYKPAIKTLLKGYM